MSELGFWIGASVAAVLIGVAIWQYKKHCR